MFTQRASPAGTVRDGHLPCPLRLAPIPPGPASFSEASPVHACTVHACTVCTETTRPRSHGGSWSRQTRQGRGSAPARWGRGLRFRSRGNRQRSVAVLLHQGSGLTPAPCGRRAPGSGALAVRQGRPAGLSSTAGSGPAASRARTPALALLGRRAGSRLAGLAGRGRGRGVAPPAPAPPPFH